MNDRVAASRRARLKETYTVVFNATRTTFAGEELRRFLGDLIQVGSTDTLGAWPSIDRHAQDRVGDAIRLMFERIVNMTDDEFALELSRQTQCARSRLRLILREDRDFIRGEPGCLSRRTA